MQVEEVTQVEDMAVDNSLRKTLDKTGRSIIFFLHSPELTQAWACVLISTEYQPRPEKAIISKHFKLYLQSLEFIF